MAYGVDFHFLLLVIGTLGTPLTPALSRRERGRSVFSSGGLLSPFLRIYALYQEPHEQESFSDGGGSHGEGGQVLSQWQQKDQEGQTGDHHEYAEESGQEG